VVDVLLDEGVHFVSQVLDCPPEQMRAGMPVEACSSRGRRDHAGEIPTETMSRVEEDSERVRRWIVGGRAAAAKPARQN